MMLNPAPSRHEHVSCTNEIQVALQLTQPSHMQSIESTYILINHNVILGEICLNPAKIQLML